MNNTPKDQAGEPLEPGALYVTMTRDDSGDRDGPFVYWTGVELIEENSHEPADFDFDYLVRQAGGRINDSVIDNDWIDRMDAIAEERAEYRATGGDL